MDIEKLRELEKYFDLILMSMEKPVPLQELLKLWSAKDLLSESTIRRYIKEITDNNCVLFSVEDLMVRVNQAEVLAVCRELCAVVGFLPLAEREEELKKCKKLAQEQSEKLTILEGKIEDQNKEIEAYKKIVHQEQFCSRIAICSGVNSFFIKSLQGYMNCIT